MEDNWYELSCIVRNKDGLHGRPAMDVSDFAQTYDGKIEIHYNNQCYDPRSLIHLLSLGIPFGSQVNLRVERFEGCERFADDLRRLIEVEEG